MKYLMALISCIILNTTMLASDFYRTNDTVVDNINNIIWQDDIRAVKIGYSQEKAREYCKDFLLNDISNWRLPTVKEYKAIVDKKNKANFINKVFKYNVAEGYWTNDVLWRMFGYYGYYMNFKNGIAYYENKTYYKYVRCVKDK